MKTSTAVHSKTEVLIELAPDERFDVHVPYSPRRFTVDTVEVVNSTTDGATVRVSIHARGFRLLKDGTLGSTRIGAVWYPFYRGDDLVGQMPAEIAAVVRQAGVEWALVRV